MTTATMSQTINGLDTQALKDVITAIKTDPSKGVTRWDATTTWRHAMTSTTEVTGWTLAGQRCPQSFSITIDEPVELLGAGAHANPQQFLLAAMNACMLNTFVATCSMLDVTLDHASIACEGEIDLRGFLGIDTKVPAGYPEIRYTLRVKGNGTREQYEKAHQAMIATSPNYFNMTRSIPLRSNLVCE